MNAEGRDESISILWPFILVAYMSAPCCISTLDATWKEGSARARFENLSLMVEFNVLWGISPVMDGNTQA